MYLSSSLILLATLFANNAAACGAHRKRTLVGPEPVPVQRRAQTTPVAITNVRYFTGSGLSALSTIQFTAGIITSIAPRANTGIPANAQVVNANGATLLPGLIESHSHPDTMAELQMLTSYGITTVFGMACAEYQNCDQLRKQTGLADFYSAGVAACTPGSAHALLLEYPPNELISSSGQAQSFVAARVASGSNYIKLIAESGGLTQDEQNALVSAAHSSGKKSATHAVQLSYYQQAITSKTDYIQHSTLDGVLSAAQIKTILSQGQTVTPTLTIMRSVSNSPLNPPNGSYANAAKTVTALHAAGVPILCGTDSADVLPLYDVAYGSSMYDELENLVAAGLSPIQALNAATSVPAQHFGFNDRGTISVGKRADLLLVGGDPTTNISNARNIQKLWVTGIPYIAVA